MSEGVAKPGLIIDKTSDLKIVEQCYNGQNPHFVVFDALTEEWEPRSQVKHNDVLYSPIQDALLEKGFIYLPSRPEDYEDELSLFNEIIDFLHEWVDVGDRTTEKLITAYILMTWLYDKMPCIPILNIRGGKGAGKSRLGTLCIRLSFRGMRGSGAATFSPIFRSVERWKGTLYLNENDMGHTDETSNLVTFLNERFEKGGGVWRSKKNNPSQTEVFNSYGPTIMTTRSAFQDDAVESKSIIIRMKETERDILLNLPPRFYEKAAELRNKLFMFRLRNYFAFKNDYELRFEGISPRMGQIVQPLGSLARMISDEFYNEIKSLVNELFQRQVKEAADSYDGRVVRAFFSLENKNGKNTGITATEISKQTDEWDCKISPAVVGKRMKALDFEQRRKGNSRPYFLEDDRKRQRLRRNYIPLDERGDNREVQRTIENVSHDSCDSYDSYMGQGGGVISSQQESIEYLRYVIDNQSVTIDDLVEFNDRVPNIQTTAKKLKEQGEIIELPNGTLEVKR